MRRQDVVVVGEIYVDHIFTGFAEWPRPGEEIFAREYVQEVGGGGAITACALARLGRSVSLIGAVGAEDLPWLQQRLERLEVAAEDLRVGDGRSGVTVSVSTGGDRTFFTHVGENIHLEDHLSDASVIDRLLQTRHVHFAMPISATAAQRLLPRLRSAGCTVSLDVGHHPQWLREPANRDTCASVDYLLPNEREADLVSGAGAEAYLEFTREYRWRSGVVKLGSCGAAMWRQDERWAVASPEVKVVDTTGAGDAFDAGFIDGLLDGATGEECLRRGCVCGGLSTRVAGALGGLPDREEFNECYEQSYES